ncbi:MAG TPA: DUF6542 domain-containing protein [Aeromicrobium sp.]|nr:DUF6542 domain-containing protein [Aeromicrobium sp.]
MSSGRDLTGPGVVILAFVAMAAVAWLDLTDGAIGAALSIGFVLIVVTAPLAVRLPSIVTTGVLPPPLLILTLLGIVVLKPTAVEVDGLGADAGTAARAIAATLDHGLTLVIGHSLALATIVVRNVWASRARALSLQRA